MKYLRLGAVKKENPNLQFPLSEDQKEEFLETFKKLFPDATEIDRTQFLSVCSNPKGIIFASWTEENSGLINTLKTGKFTELFIDSSKLREHALFEEYRTFIELYLFPIFTDQFSSLSEENIHFFMSYSVLLPDYQQNLVQDSLSDWIFKQKEELDVTLNKAKKDTDLHRLTDTFLSPNMLSALDLLNVNHYRVKTQLLEFFMSLAYHPKSSTRFLTYLSGKLATIRFTEEHRKQLSNFGADVKKGKIVVESTRVSWLRLSLIILILLVCVSGIIALFFVEADPETDTMQEQTAYMEFSKEERLKLDSMITEIKSEERMVEDAQLDSNLPFVGVDLVKKRDWNNELFGKLYKHWGNNDSVPYTTFFTQGKPAGKPYIKTRDLDRKTGEITAELHNETTMMVLLVVFQNNKKEPVYTEYVEAKSVAEWKINIGDYLFVLPGNKASSDPAFGELPFKELDQHFFENLGISYRVDYFNGKRIKLVWENLGNNESYLVDLSGVLIKE
ncbi:MAG: hypothetical protein K0S23_3589 [Fluviicola sp.]|jgi:hypothetical protein|uniref:hypothetical protein n=1 Tax=Fluviicola sp. TaxID=1917219 RepID=UPI002614A89E|nr:hypothetical protein [Fluviicola sp.]MDF3029282.1 hypothetical protein [Fluviicola sp.]